MRVSSSRTAEGGPKQSSPTAPYGPGAPPTTVIAEGRLLVVLVATMFLVVTNINMMGPLLLDLANEFHTSVGAIGQLAAAAALPWALLAPFMGVLSDRYGRRPTLALGTAVLGLTTILSAGAWAYVALLAFRVLGGVGGATTGPTIFSSAADYFPPHRRGKALGTLMAGMSLATVAGIPMVALFASYVGWRLAFSVQGVLLLFLGLAVWKLFPVVKPTASHSGYISGFATVLTDGPLTVLLSANLLERACYTAVTTYTAAYLMQSYSLQLGEVAPVLSAIAGGTLLGSLLGGRLADRGRQALVYSGFQVAAAATALPLFTTASGVLVTAALAAGFGLFNSMARPSWLWIVTRVPEKRRGATMGFTTTANQIGIMLGAFLGGALVGHGDYSGIGFAVAGAGIMSGALCLAGAARMKRKQ